MYVGWEWSRHGRMTTSISRTSANYALNPGPLSGQEGESGDID